MPASEGQRKGSDGAEKKPWRATWETNTNVGGK